MQDQQTLHQPGGHPLCSLLGITGWSFGSLWSVLKLRGVYAVAALLAFISIARGQQSFAVEYSPRLKVTSTSELSRRLRSPFEEGIARPAGTSTCTQLLARNRKNPLSVANSPAERSTLADCLVLSQLQKARMARTSFVHDLLWNEQVLPLLPPSLAITVSHESRQKAIEAERKGQSWTDTDTSLRVDSKGSDEVVVTGSGFRQRLILWGRGDFTGNGVEDLLVQSLDALTEGTYRTTRLLVLTRTSKDGRLCLVRQIL